MTENIYALYHGADADPTIFYIGKCVGPVERRFKQHLRGIADHANPKSAYEYARHIGIDQIKVVHLGDTTQGTEADFVRQATLEGHRLYNDSKGNSKVAKRRSVSVFSVINRQADETLERSERRTILHSPAQQLSKSQVVAARIRGELPTVEQLSSCEWHATASQMVGGIAANTAERCEYTRIGDVSVYVAYRGKRDITAVARHRDGRVCGLPSSLWWSCPKDKLLNVLALEMHSEYGWQRPFEKS